MKSGYHFPMGNVLFLEPYYSGSHKYFADGLIRFSSHNIRLMFLPGRHWKWRMESGALELSEIPGDFSKADLVFATNLMDLPQWKTFSGLHSLPMILYAHENQLDYPLKKGEKRDYHYGWKDYINYMAADRIIFNSLYNLDSFCSRLTELSPSLPGFKPNSSVKIIREKSLIIPPGCSLISPSPAEDAEKKRNGTPVFIWNHRWEHDKNPEAFFRLLKKIKESGRKFQLILLGEKFRDSPDCFNEAAADFADEMIHFGYAESRKCYEDLLRKADFVFSTALQENFGISIIEAVSAGAIPLLPERLAYPEVLPEEFHSQLLYSSEEDLLNKTLSLMDRKNLDALKADLIQSIEKYGWKKIIPEYDSLIESMLQ